MSKKAHIAHLDQVLIPLGFIRYKTTWNRKAGSLVDVIDIQVSKALDTFTINAGVLDVDIHSECWGGEEPSIVEEPLCTVRARIGELVDGKDKWWKVADDMAAEDIALHVDKFVLPFFEKMHSREGMVEHLTNAKVIMRNYPPPVIYLALLKRRLGNVHEACALLSELRNNTTGTWHPRITEIS